ncbi:MAG: hypothetical protein ABI051_09870 [Vicinamibacterales bacterium]
MTLRSVSRVAFALIALGFCGSGLALSVAASSQVPARPLSPRPQPASVAEVRALLQSSSLEDKAWGAWWAGEGKLRELEPALRANLQAALGSPVGGFEAEVALDDTLDALIRFGANGLPVDLLTRIYAEPHRQAEALILLAHSSAPRDDVDRFLMSIVGQKDGAWRWVNWFAAADLLLSRKTPGLVAAVLQDLPFKAHLVICPRIDDCRWVGMGTVGSWSSGGSDLRLPPWAHYILMKPGTTGTLLVEGPTPETTMAYGRYTGPLRLPGPASGPTAGEALAVIAAAVPGVQIPPIDGEILRVEARANGVYEDVTTPFRRDLEARYAQMVRALGDAGLLSASEMTSLATPRLEVAVEHGLPPRTP